MEDLSHMANQSTILTAGESGAAGNTVNRPLPPGVGAPGSAPVNPPPAISELDAPGMEIPPVKEPTVTGKYSNGVPSSSPDWKKAG